MENVIYRGKTSLDELVYGLTVSREYCVTIADGAFRDIMDKEGKRHVVYADTVELKIIGKSKWVKLPSEYAEQRERAYRKYYITNEEWFCQLPTEEKAKFLVDVDCGFCGYVCSHRNECEKYDKERDEYRCECVYGDCTAVEMRVAWLKEVYKE